MNLQRFIAITVAIAINCAVLAWFHAWSAGVIASAAAASAHTATAVTLPVRNVRPNAAQSHELQREGAAPAPTRTVQAPPAAAMGSV